MKVVKNSYFQSKVRVSESRVHYIELHLSLGTWKKRIMSNIHEQNKALSQSQQQD